MWAPLVPIVGLLLAVACSSQPSRTSATPVAAPPVTASPKVAATTTTTPTTIPSPTTTTTTVRSAAAPGEWTLLAVGDVLMDDTEEAGIDPFARVTPALVGADLALVNAEMAIASPTTGVAAEKSFTFRAAPSAATRLARAGVDVANLANNHSLDFGPVALAETLGHLRSAGVSPVGAGPDADAAYAPATFTVQGVRVAVIGASRVLPRADWAAGAGPGLASAYAERRLLDAVRGARDQAEVVVVAVHWGREGNPCPEPAQERLGAELLDAGASVVVGSHPHVLQPILADARGVVAYSLGNFVFHRRRGPTGDSGVLEVRFSGARVVGHQLHPHVLDQGPPRPADTTAAARIARSVTPPCTPPPPPLPPPTIAAETAELPTSTPAEPSP